MGGSPINNMFNNIEPLKLTLGKEFNLNNIKEIEVSEDFLSLDKSIIECQNMESAEDCKTRKYTNNLVKECNCFPFGMGHSKQVYKQ